MAVLLGLFAHPDDEIFCVGGALARYSAAGVTTHVVSATRGEAGQIRDAAAATRRVLGQVREAELNEACARLGVTSVRCLDYRDGTLSTLAPQVLVDEAIGVIRELRPDVVVTFGLDGAYGHPDHVSIGNAVTSAVAQMIGSSDPATPSRLYHSHFPRSRLLLTDRLAGWLVTLADRFRGSDDFAHALTLFAQESTTMRSASDHLDVQWFPPGVYIVEQDEAASSLYLILSGHAEVRQEAGGETTVLRTLGQGEFFGELGVAGTGRRSASVVAQDNVTCLVFSPGQPTQYAGRGTDPTLPTWQPDHESSSELSRATTVIDASEFISQKMSALAAHRTQFPLPPDLLPRDLLIELLGSEHFVRVHPPIAPETELLP